MVSFQITVLIRERGTTPRSEEAAYGAGRGKVLYQDIRRLVKNRRSCIRVTTSRGAILTFMLYIT